MTEDLRTRLWELAQCWPRGAPAASREQSILDDHSHWKLFQLSCEHDDRSAREFEEYWTSAACKFLGRGFSEEQVEEFVAVFFSRVYEKAKRFQWRTPFTVYLRTVLLNIARDEIRRLRRLPPQAAVADPTGSAEEPVDRRASDPEGDLLTKERHAIIESALNQLAPLDRHIVRACLLDGCSGQEVADALGLRRGTIYQRLYRSKRRLRTLIKRAGGV